LLVLAILTPVLFLSGCASTERQRFEFSSGGAWHFEGFGEWRVAATSDGQLGISHDVQGKVKDYGKFTLTKKENAELWNLIGRVKMVSIDRPLVPDETVYTLKLETGTGTQTAKIPHNDAKDDIKALTKHLGALIEKYTGVKPVM
jgi:hypothetical protein